MLSVYPLLLLGLILYRAQISPGGEYSTAFMSPKQCRMVRGAACAGVILHHLTQQLTGYGSMWRGPVTIFSEAGYLFTAIFFFFSGYGLIISVHEREDYLENFPVRRLTTVLIPFWLINAVIVVVNACTGRVRLQFRSVIMYVSGLLLVNSNGWFIVEIVILYLLFYFSFRLIKNKNISLIALSAATVVLIVRSAAAGHDPQGAQIHWFRGEWWYNSTAAFLFGAWYARFRGRADSLWTGSTAGSDPETRRGAGRKYAALLSAAAVCFASAFFAAVRINRRFGYYLSGSAGRNASLITFFSQTLACLAFLIFLLALLRKITINSPVLTWIGGIGPELFLIHRFVMDLLSDGLRKDPFLWYAAVLAGSLIAASVLSPLTHMLTRWVRSKFESRCAGQDGFHSAPAARGRVPGKYVQSGRMKKAAVRIALPLAVLAALYLTVGRDLIRAEEARREYLVLQNARVGERVLFGRFNTDAFVGRERLSWIVVSRESKELRLLCEKGISGSFYHRKHEAVSWEESDLRKLLNSDDYLNMFSKAERELLVPDGEDLVSLLTVREAKEFFQTDEQRELDVTEAAKAHGTNTNRFSKANYWDMKSYRSSWWWLRGEHGQKEITAPIVTVDGTVSEGVKYVNKPGGAVRPVIKVKVP